MRTMTRRSREGCAIEVQRRGAGLHAMACELRTAPFPPGGCNGGQHGPLAKVVRYYCTHLAISAKRFGFGSLASFCVT
jgi:hypothetical protein